MNASKILAKIRKFQALPEREKLEMETKKCVDKGFETTGMENISKKWIISEITFLKWYYKVESAAETNARAERDNILEIVASVFLNECGRIKYG
jgi:hypothetical protein